VEGVVFASWSGAVMRDGRDSFEAQGGYTVVESIAEMGYGDYAYVHRLYANLEFREDTCESAQIR